MKEFTYVIQDAEGLHARPAGLIVKLAQAMDSRVTLTANEKTADCKRLFAVMKLAAKCGQELRVTVEAATRTPPARHCRISARRSCEEDAAMITLHGIPASPGGGHRPRHGCIRRCSWPPMRSCPG